jgi:hypothetical protein
MTLTAILYRFAYNHFALAYNHFALALTIHALASTSMQVHLLAFAPQCFARSPQKTGVGWGIPPIDLALE